ncbi:MAG: hypothetical protein GXP49_10590 [Deltaproteobacteria bacterium]|nr:hypothetical protein [Deltaproteobacteria bacterium]
MKQDTGVMSYLIIASGFALGFLAQGCAVLTDATPHSYLIRRSALVNPPAPPLWSGRINAFGMTMGDSTVVWSRPPERAEGARSGLYVSRTKLDSTLHVRFGKHVAVWIPFSYGPSAYSFNTAPCPAHRPSESYFEAGGIGFAASGHLSPHWYLGGSGEAQLAFVPARMEVTCLDCSYRSTDSARVVVFVGRLSLVAGYDFGSWRLFGGATVQNQPTNNKDTTVVSYIPPIPNSSIGTGDTYAAFGGGVEVDMGSRFSLLAQVYQPFNLAGPEDLVYGPIAAIAFDLHAPRIHNRSKETN